METQDFYLMPLPPDIVVDKALLEPPVESPAPATAQALVAPLRPGAWPRSRALDGSVISVAGAAVVPPVSAWAPLISFRPPHAVQRSLQRTWTPNWHVHRIEDGYGDVNLDYYPVTIASLPTLGGRTVSAEELVSYVRLNLNSFVNLDISEFTPYDDEEAAKWTSASPLTAVVHIDMKTWAGWANPDDGSVVCAEIAPDHWTFSTIWTPGDFGHPVSGNRQFGVERRDDGSYTFYTRGADRTTGASDWAISGTVFGAAEALWQSLQNGIANFVNANGGAATVGARTSVRYDWNVISVAFWMPSTTWL